MAISAFCGLSAQNVISDIVSKVAMSMGVSAPDSVIIESLSEYCADIINSSDANKKENPATFKLRAVQNDSHYKFTERVRVPDVSNSDRVSPKYYYLKNVKTGKYLQFRDLNSPLGLADVPDAKCRFYFINQGLGGYMASFVNDYCNSDDVFYGPGKNYWSHGGLPLNNPRFAFNVLEDNSGFFISNEEYSGFASVAEGGVPQYGEVWTYNPETGNIEIAHNRVNDYAVWVAEPVYEIPSASNSSDTVWYVVRNVETGKFLHYEGPDAAMTTVTSPDTCSLFYGMSDGRFGNYTAGDGLSCAGIDAWDANGVPFEIGNVYNNRFYISESGKGTYWSVNGNGVVYEADSYNSDKSLWQFEPIINFSEIFGIGGNWEQGISMDILEEVISILDSGKMTPTEYYSSVISILVVALVGNSYLDDIGAVKEREELFGMLRNVVVNSEEILDDMSIFNADYLEEDAETGRIKIKGLATNTTSLIVNDMTIVVDSADESVLKLARKADQRHTNIWKFYMKGIYMTQPDGSLSLDVEEEDIWLVFYNTATRMYLSAPFYDENGELTVTMTSVESEAGKYSMESMKDMQANDDEIFSLLEGYYGGLQFISKDIPNCYLYLPSSDDIALSCIVTETPDEVPGINWMYVAATSVINDNFYNHAMDAVNKYPEFLQTNFGLITDPCTSFTSNFELVDENSSPCNLADNDAYSAFWTKDVNNGNGEKHYLQADLGENNAVSSFSFYIKPNLNSYNNVPASITVSGCNEADGEFVVLAENIEMPNLLYDMYYFSDVISTTGEKYRYLRFTVNSVNAGENEREFTLSEFYIYQDNEHVDKAKNDINDFHDENFIDIGIMDPAISLLKQKAEYLLEENKNNHAENPVEGQYPTSAYNALKDACESLEPNNQDSVDRLYVALEEFMNSLVKPVEFPIYCIIESAWEDGYSRGMAMGLVSNDVGLQETNIWDLRQWFRIDKTDDSYWFGMYSLPEDVALPINIDVVDNGNSIVDDAEPAYRIALNDVENNALYYPCVDKDGNGVPIITTISAVSADVEQRTSWYMNKIVDATDVGIVTDETFIEALADFGKTLAKAEYLYNGEQGGQFVYVNQNGMSLEYFEEIYWIMKPYYDLGPVELINMYASGQITAENIEYMCVYIAELKECFPNFVINTTFFRLRSRASGNILTSKTDGTMVMASEFDSNGEFDKDVELNSILYSSLDKNAGRVSVLSYENGRYLKAENGQLKYDIISQDGEDFQRQGAYYDLATGKANLEGNYIVDNGTSVEVVSEVFGENTARWDIEPVDELPVRISSAKFATFCAPVELQIPSGVIAYVLYEEAKAVTGDYNIATDQMIEENADVFRVKAVEGGLLPAGLPVILQAAKAGTYYFKINYLPVLERESQKQATYGYVTNLLDGRHEVSYIPEWDGYTHYILSNGTEGVGMYKVNTYERLTSEDGITTEFETYSFRNNAHRAWLPLSNARSNSAYRYFFSTGGVGNTTGIDEPVWDENESDDVVYDLQGRRVDKIIDRGIYIINGKRVFVK